MAKVSKSMRTQLFNVALAEMPEQENNCYDIIDVISPSTKLGEIIPAMEKWLDKNCSNGHFSRWTAFGSSLYERTEAFVRRLKSVYKEYGF